jgi:hypothetical protein
MNYLQPALGDQPQGPPPIPQKSMPPPGTVDPDSGLIIRGPDPNAIAARQAQAKMSPLDSAVQQAEQRVAAGPPQLNSNWAQRLGMAILSVTKLAPAAMQIVHPQWTQQMAAYQQAEKDLGTLSSAQEAQQRGAWYQAQANEGKGRYLRVGDGVFDQLTGQWVTQPTNKSNLVPVDPARAKALGIGTLDDGKYYLPQQTAIELLKLGNAPEGGIHVRPTEATSKMGFVPDPNSGLVYIPKEGVGEYVGKELAAPPAPNAESQKLAQQNAIAKMEMAGEQIPAAAFMDQSKLISAIRNSKVLTLPEKAAAVGYEGINTSPSSQGSAATIRIEGRIGAYIDTQTGQAVSMNAEEFNAANRGAPGRYVQSTVAVPAMQRHATFAEIQNAIDQARSSIPTLGSLDAGSRAELANALADETGGRMTTFLNGAVQTTMSPAQRNAVIALKNLNESALALRSVQGLGQGSEQMRRAILATLPTGTSPDTAYMLDQLKTFERSVQKLHQGTPGLGGPAVVAPSLGGGRGGALTPDDIRRRLSGR